MSTGPGVGVAQLSSRIVIGNSRRLTGEPAAALQPLVDLAPQVLRVRARSLGLVESLSTLSCVFSLFHFTPQFLSRLPASEVPTEAPASEKQGRSPDQEGFRPPGDRDHPSRFRRLASGGLSVMIRIPTIKAPTM